MKTLMLKDGTTLTVEDESTVGTFRIPVENYAEIDTLKAKITRENLSDITIGTAVFTDVINEKVIADCDDNGEIVAIFLNRMGTQDIVQDAIDAYTMDLIDGGIIG